MNRGRHGKSLLRAIINYQLPGRATATATGQCRSPSPLPQYGSINVTDGMQKDAVMFMARPDDPAAQKHAARAARAARPRRRCHVATRISIEDLPL